MVEIEKPRIDCEDNGDSSYGKYVVEPLPTNPPRSMTVSSRAPDIIAPTRNWNARNVRN